MKIDEWKQYISDTYHTEAEYLWKKYPDFCIFRHSNNQKWFALIAMVEKEKIGIKADGMVDILNIKLEPVMIDLLKASDGFYSAYHMNKTNWITIVLDGTVPDEKIMDLLDMSFELTDTKKRKK